MSAHRLLRTSLLAVAPFLLSACASASKHDVAWGPVDGPMCTVRVESDFAMDVDAAARAGGREIDLGTVEPDAAHEFVVPCEYRAVTVYRVIPASLGEGSRLDARARALDTDDVTVVVLRPASARRATSWR
mgnify:CR=1 FL=1